MTGPKFFQNIIRRVFSIFKQLIVVVGFCNSKRIPHYVALLIITEFPPLIAFLEIYTIKFIFLFYIPLKLFGYPRFIFDSLSRDLNKGKISFRIVTH